MSISPIEDINAAIESYNPFEKLLAIVREQDIWDGEFPDVTTLNAHASTEVFQAIEQVREDKFGRNKITSMVITAGKGVGKSHIIRRIRRRIKADGSAFLVYAGVEKYAFNSINYEFQKTLAESLDQIGSKGVTQWQELATSMANQVWRTGNPNAQSYTAKKIVENLNNPNTPEEKFYQWIELITDKFCRISRSNRIDPDIIKAIFWTLSESQALYAIKWLSGKDISANKINELKLPYSNIDLRDSESKYFDNTLKILSLISNYKTLLICFDELDLPDIRRSSTGLARPHIVARLIKTLIDSISLSDSSNGVVILTVMMPDTWSQKIKLMPGGVPDRVSAKGNPINLNFMDSDSIIELVTLWLTEFYQERNLTPPTQVYPFEKNQLIQLGADNSARQVLKWCAENFKVNGGTPPPKHPVEPAYNKELEGVASSVKTWLEDNTQLGNALALGFTSLRGQIIENIKIERLEKVEPQKDNKGYINFKIIGEANNKTLKIGVAVVQQAHWRSIGAALSRLIDYKKFALSRGCLVRSKGIKGAASAQEYWNKLLSPEWGGKWVQLKVEDIKPLLAIWSVYVRREDYELSDQQIVNFIEQKRLAIDNSIIRDILSEPSGKMPDGLVDE